MIFNISYGQILVNSFTSDGRIDYKFIKDFQSTFVQELRDYYYIEERSKYSIEQMKRELSLSSDNSDFFDGTVSPRFTSGVYLVNAELGNSGGSSILFNVTMDVIEVETAHKYVIHLTNLKRSEMKDIVRDIAQFIKYKSPVYFSLSFVNREKDIYGINYGEDRGADKNDKLEIYDIDNDNVLGLAKIKRIFTKSSHVKVKWFNKRFNPATKLDDFRVRRDVDLNAAENMERKLDRYSEGYVYKIQDKREDQFKKARILEMENNNWIVLSVNSFQFNQDIEYYFDKQDLLAFDPLVFTAQLNLSKAPLRMFFKGRYSLTYEVQSGPLMNDNVSSSFYQVGMGVQNQFHIAKILYPGISLSVFYMGLHSEQDRSSDKIEVNFSGMDIEATANVTLKLANLGFYGEFGYHFIPFLNHEDTKLKGSALSVGLGVSVFF